LAVTLLQMLEVHDGRPADRDEPSLAWGTVVGMRDPRDVVLLRLPLVAFPSALLGRLVILGRWRNTI
jgi:hypothetical protein